MAIGLKRGVVELADHDPEWKTLAMQMIGRLWGIFSSTIGCYIRIPKGYMYDGWKMSSADMSPTVREFGMMSKPQSHMGWLKPTMN
jgi:hypothetical protein